MDFLSFALGFLIAALLSSIIVARFFSRKKVQLQLQKQLEQQLKEISQYETQRAVLELQTSNLRSERALLLQKNEQTEDRIQDLLMENNTLEIKQKHLQDKFNEQKIEFDRLQQEAATQFENIANKILEEKTSKFTETNKINLDLLIKPLQENIKEFKTKVEETYDRESKERFSLSDRVKELIEQTNKVSAEANNLATALKGQVKKQGNWGELILESILQHSGLVKDREYFTQVSQKDEEGKSKRPDVLVKLPDERVIIIDSKVSLTAYERFTSAATPEQQAVHLQEHIASLRKHIQDLESKKYDQHEKSLDFTMLFVPIEPAYLVAIQQDADLWNFAFQRRILLISPTNLIACLKLMAELWKKDIQSRNAQDIVKRGALLYDKLMVFAQSIDDIGTHLDKAQSAYSKAFSQMTSGQGNLISQAVKLKEMGIQSDKKIDDKFLR